MKEAKEKEIFFSTQQLTNKFTSFYLYIIVIQNTHARARLLTKQDKTIW